MNSDNSAIFQVHNCQSKDFNYKMWNSLAKNSTAHEAMTFLEMEHPQYIKSVYLLALGIFKKYSSTKSYVLSNNNFTD